MLDLLSNVSWQNGKFYNMRNKSEHGKYIRMHVVPLDFAKIHVKFF